MNTMNTLSERIAYILEQRGISQSALAVRVGIKQPSVAAWLSGKTKKIEGENLLNTAAALGVHPEWLATGSGPIYKDGQEEGTFPRTPSEADYALIPHYSTKGACGNGFMNEHVELKGGLAFRRDWLNRFGLDEKTACVISASGDSMFPSINDGDTILIDQRIAPVRSGEVYAVVIDEEVYIKRLAKEFGITVLRSDNPSKATYPDISVPPGHDLTVIGRVVWRGGGM
jgi:phage repressor protein C with HTH and peptisase S24 domain